MKARCSIGFVEVCVGPQEDGEPCELCRRKLEREMVRERARG